MKKNFVKVMATTFALSMALAFTGCGGKDNDNTPSSAAGNTEAATTETTAEQTAEQTTEANDEQTPLEQLLASPEADALVAQLSNDQSTMELVAENGNILVFRCTLNEQVDLSDAAVQEQVASTMLDGLESQSSLYTTMLSTLRSQIGQDDLALRIEYLNADGTEIVSKDFE